MCSPAPFFCITTDVTAQVRSGRVRHVYGALGGEGDGGEAEGEGGGGLGDGNAGVGGGGGGLGGEGDGGGGLRTDVLEGLVQVLELLHAALDHLRTGGGGGGLREGGGGGGGVGEGGAAGGAVGGGGAGKRVVELASAAQAVREKKSAPPPPAGRGRHGWGGHGLGCGPNEYYLDCYGPLNGFCVADEESLSRELKSLRDSVIIARAKAGALSIKASSGPVLPAVHATGLDGETGRQGLCHSQPLNRGRCAIVPKWAQSAASCVWGAARCCAPPDVGAGAWVGHAIPQRPIFALFCPFEPLPFCCRPTTHTARLFVWGGEVT